MATRPAVAYVVNALNAGGTERLVCDMSVAMADEFDVSVVCLDEPGTWAGPLRRQGIAVHCVWRQPGLDLSMPGRLARLFRQWGTSIVHAHQCTPWFYSALARLSYPSAQVLLEEHGRFFPEVYSAPRFWLNRLLIRRLTARSIAVSEDIRRRLVAYEGLRERDVDVIYNGVKPGVAITPAQRHDLRARLGFSPDDFVIGTVGRFDPIKNLPLFVAALHRIIGRHPRVAGLLVGAGPVFDDIARDVAAGPAAARIVLAGYRADARELAQCMDLFVLPSFSEGTSMALLEAIIEGVPAVVTDVGGNPEVVLAGQTGWVVPSNDLDALSAALEEAYRDEPLRTARAAAGRARARETFSVDGMLSRYRALYRSLLREEGGSP